MQQNDSTANRARGVALDLQASCLGVRIGRLNRLVGRRFDQALRPMGLSVAQIEILGALILSPNPLRPADLAGWLAVERSTMSRNLAHMEQRGYVRTAETSPTGRSQKVAITARGQATLAEAEHAWRDTQQSVARDLGDDAVSMLDAWLTSLSP